MLQITVPKNDKNHHEWESQLKDWCVAHKITIDEQITEPSIQEGKNEIILGTEAIKTFLKEYRSFMDEWYDCRCDRWMDDKN